ncbi:mitochondrial fission ELM1 family protein [Arenimonas sp.]|uniref:mitochondrial fission ELM1 family protein n=1 Tax=Arenimonas sp. TaxID=1872635 RepID=UPI002E366D70|nr:mitochondrial fission ELM1 family protein [Arenimonas sp.]HEX4853112.1 mitochondrial fission ELM1 family protein [Arenimonas sp.]
MPFDPTPRFLHDGAAGHRLQALALARALDPAAKELALSTRAPWSWFAPRRLPGADAAFGEAFRKLLDAPPAWAVGCGRRPALATRLLRARGSRVVQLLHPRLDPSHWDLVVAPGHDGLRGPNVITLCGSLHAVDDAWLAEGRAAFPGFASLPAPRTAVLLGGPTAAVRFDRGAFEVMAAKLEHWLAVGGGSLLVVGSRRTPAQLAMLSRTYWADTPGLRWFDASDGPNPYAGALGWADRIVVSPDSVNMVSEACATSAPVYVAEPDRATGRIRRYLDDVLARGRIQPLGKLPHDVACEPLRETPRVAALVRDAIF